MPSLTDRLRTLVGGTARPGANVKPSAQKSKSLLPPSQREALIAGAMAIYRQQAAGMRGVIEDALRQLRDKPPNIRDADAYARLFSIHRAVLGLRRLMNHRERRYLVLAGLRELLEQKPRPDPSKAPRRKVVRR